MTRSFVAAASIVGASESWRSADYLRVPVLPLRQQDEDGAGSDSPARSRCHDPDVSSNTSRLPSPAVAKSRPSASATPPKGSLYL